MTRRWSLITLIVGLAVALTFVLVDISTTAAAGKPPAAAATDPAAPDLKGVGWWAAHEKAGPAVADAMGHHDAQLRGGASWTEGPHGGAVLLDGTGYADTGAAVLDTAGKDYSVAAWVRLDAKVRANSYTAVSQDSAKAVTFALQYAGADKRFAFSFANARALAAKTPEPQTDRWYHLVGTYSQQDRMLRIYVDGVAAGATAANNPELPSGHLVIGRGRLAGNPADFWKGAISDVHVYQRVLNPAEVALLAANEPS